MSLCHFRDMVGVSGFSRLRVKVSVMITAWAGKPILEKGYG